LPVTSSRQTDQDRIAATGSSARERRIARYRMRSTQSKLQGERRLLQMDLTQILNAVASTTEHAKENSSRPSYIASNARTCHHLRGNWTRSHEFRNQRFELHHYSRKHRARRGSSVR